MERSTAARLLRMSCALWDGNGPHNQLELRITAALWVPLQSHPPKQASGLVNTARRKENGLLTGGKGEFTLQELD